MFGLVGSEIVVVLMAIVLIVVLPLYFSYKAGFNKGYLKAMKELNRFK